MSDQRHDIASSDDATKWWKQSSSNDENQNGKNVPKLNRKVPLTPGAAIALSVLCIVLMLPGAELRMPSQIEKSHSMMFSLNMNLLDESTEQDPPCSGYFVFVVDDSSNTDFDSPEIVQSIANITHNWKLDDKLQLTVAITASGSTTANNFAKDLKDWTKMLDDSIDMMGSLDPPTTPIQLSNNLSSLYCNSDSEYKIAQGGSVKFIIFTSVSNETEINNALNAQKPWLNCALAGSESVFMVAVDGGSTNLNKLSIPASDLFMQMKDLDQNSVQELNKKISNTMCDCTKLSDGSSSPGCLLPSPPPTTSTPIVTSTSSDKPTTALTNTTQTTTTSRVPSTPTTETTNNPSISPVVSTQETTTLTSISQSTTTTSSEVRSREPSTPSIIPTQETTTLTSISQSTTATSSEESSDKPSTPPSTSSSGPTPAPNATTSPDNDHSTSRPSSYGIRNALALPVHYVLITTLVIMNIMSY